MAYHCRKQIRDAVLTYLAAHMTTVETFQTARAHPLTGSTPPALLVLTPDETIDPLNKAGDGMRNLNLTLEAYATGAAVVDTLDAIAAEAEAMVMTALPAWVKLAPLVSTTVTLSGDAVSITGVMQLEYQITYHVNPAAPSVPL